MEYYELHPVNPELRYINKAIKILQDGGVIIYPTDTVYGIGCDIFNKQALDRVKEIKSNPDIKLLSFICPDLKDIAKYAKVSDYAYKTMKRLITWSLYFYFASCKECP